MDSEQPPLDETEFVPCFEAPVNDAKEMLEACNEADIEATLARGNCCGSRGCGCAPKMQLLVHPEDVPRVAQLMRSRWSSLVEREGVEPVEAAAEAGEHTPCPACGTAAPLVEGACSDCGLQLE